MKDRNNTGIQDDHTDSLLRRNLKDAGCGPVLVADILALQKNGKDKEVLRLLARQRSGLLEKLHSLQKKIDCLDYLVFHLKQDTTTNSRRKK